MAEKRGSRLEATNMLCDTPSDLAKEFNQTRDLYEGQGKNAVFHVSLNPAEGDKIQDARALAEDYMREMQMDPDKHEYVLYKHIDTGRPHYHLIASRVGRDGKEFWNDKFSKRRNMDAMRELEIKHGLKRMPSKQKGQGRSQKIEEQYQANKAGLDQHPKETIRLAVDHAIKGCDGTKAAFERWLDQEHQIEVNWRTKRDGTINGVSYRLKDAPKGQGIADRYAGGSLGRGYACGALESRLEQVGRYEKDVCRDIQIELNDLLKSSFRNGVGRSAKEGRGRGM
ncbi:relaxase/mobilization nuclease domain-containing protein [Pseudodesulfovibrio sp. JC047]|nr:relaxase/mobilization nuclease domain-containing protein [Pseudodesulfovibrio sp. JC047]